MKLNHVRRLWPLLRGPLLAAGVAGLVALLARTPLRIPNPAPVLLTTVVYAAFIGGRRSGLISAGVVGAFTLIHFSIPGQPFHYTSGDLRRVVVLLIAAPVIAWLVGTLRRHVERLAHEQAMQAATHSAERRFHDLVQGLDAIIWESDAERGQYSFVSRSAEAILGYPISRWMNEANFWIDHVHPDDREHAVARWRALLNGGQESELEYRMLDAEGRVIWMRSHARVIRDAAGRVQCMRGFMVDITARKRAEEQRLELLARETEARLEAEDARSLAEEARAQAEAAADALRRLQAVSDAALAHLKLDDLLVKLLSRTREVLAADTATILLLTEDGQHLIERASLGFEGIAGPDLPIRIGQGLAGQIAAQVEALIIDDLSLIEVKRLKLRARGLRSLLGVPLLVAGRPTGVLHVGTVRAHRFGPDDAQFLQRVGDRVALAVEQARLYEAERAARQAAEQAAQRMTRLQAVTSALSEALTPAQAAHVVVEQCITAMAARASAIALLAEDGRELQVIHAVGYSPDVLAPGMRLPMQIALPLQDAVKSGEPLFFESREAGLRRYPRLATLPTGNEALAMLPLVLEGRPLGGMALGFAQARSFTDEDRAFVRALAQQCAQAIGRARLYEAERVARRQAQAAEAESRQQAERLNALAEASRAFAEASLDFHAVLEVVCRRAATLMGDLSMIQLLSDDGEWIHAAAVYHANPDALAFMRELAGSALQRSDQGLSGQVIQTGQPLRLAVMAPSELPENIESGVLAYVERFGVQSMLLVPMRGRGRIAGTLGLSRERPGQPYTEADEIFLQDLADRAALALENAKYYFESQEAVRAREEFLSIAAHELRTPVTVVQGYAQGLQRQLHRIRAGDGRAEDGGKITLDRDRLIGTVQKIEHGARRLTRLIEELLDLARIQNRTLTLDREHTDLAGLVSSVVENIQLQQRNGQYSGDVALTLQLPPAGPVWGHWDASRLEQALVNLIDNAFKYSPNAGAITVALSVEDCPETDGLAPDSADGYRIARQAHLQVRDQGIGVPPEHQAQIFQPFVRASNVSARNFSGFGVGLAITKEIIELHNGRIWVESPGMNQGSSFHITFPGVEEAGEQS